MENWTLDNSKAWEVLFHKYKIIENVNEVGFFKIHANQIKETGREPRLMTKFDCSENLPDIFIENNLAILPIKRGSYLISRFKNYQGIALDNDVEVKTMYLPDYVSTIDFRNITSEAISLNAAYISGMLEDVIGEEVVPTLQGRMGTGDFDYKIFLNNDEQFEVHVEKSQMEIDGSYEGNSKFVIIEAKNHYMNDFIIRQLYYPYRVCKRFINKEILPILLLKHDNTFNFFVYEFLEDNNYNSIHLKTIKRYILGELYHSIEFEDIENVMNEVSFSIEDNDIPFPQANSVYKILDLINDLNNQSLTLKEIAEMYDFDIRQACYYIAAGRYLGFISKQSTILTNDGKKLVAMNYKEKNLALVRAILAHKPFYFALESYLKNFDFDLDAITDFILSCRSELSYQTARRRTSTVISWVTWIINLSTFADGGIC